MSATAGSALIIRAQARLLTKDLRLNRELVRNPPAGNREKPVAQQQDSHIFSVMNSDEKYKEVPSWIKRIEFKLDRFNHLMELIRTCLAGCTFMLQIVILLKLFQII